MMSFNRYSRTVADELSFSTQLKATWPINILGVVAFCAGIIITIWNEAYAVASSKALEDALLTVSSVENVNLLEKALVEKLVYLNGVLNVQEPLTEPDYGVSVMAVKLKRRVQMYQWVEGKIDQMDSDGNIISDDYYYYKDWKDKLIDSQQFETTMSHWNPREFPIKSQMQISEKVFVGAYQLGSELKDLFNDFVEIASDERPERRDIKLHAGLYYHSLDVWNPEVGDVRVQISYAGQEGSVVTVLAKLSTDGVLVPHESEGGIKLLFLRGGTYSLEEVFALQNGESQLQMWFFRGAAWALMYLGCVCLSNVARVCLHRSRFLRRYLAPSQSSLKMTVSMSASLFLTSLSWMWYRPYMGASLVFLSLIFVLCTRCLTQEPHNVRYGRI